MEQQKPSIHAGKRTPDLQTTMAFLVIVTGVAAAMTQSENWITFSFWAFVLFGAVMFFVLLDSDCYAWVLGKFDQTRWTRSYRGLVGIPFTKIWHRISGPLPRQAAFAATLRAAAQPSVMDFALRVAVVYPSLLLILPWMVWHSDAKLGNVTVLEATDFWPARAMLAALIATLFFLLVVVPLLHAWNGVFEKLSKYKDQGAKAPYHYGYHWLSDRLHNSWCQHSGS
jgi:hypothetical protein